MTDCALALSSYASDLRLDRGSDPAELLLFTHTNTRSTSRYTEVTVMAQVAEYTIRPLAFDEEIVAKVMERRSAGASVAEVAQELSMGLGKTAMAELIGTTKRANISDPAALARAIVKDRRTGKSWGWLAARYGVTEGTCRAAYTAAAGEPWQALDFRKGKPVETGGNA